jgi:hypothetical protein
MDLLPTTRQITLAVLLVAGLALPQATSWKGMIVARPAVSSLSVEAQMLGLASFCEARILVEEMPSALQESLSRAEVEGWVAAKLKGAGIRVLTKEDVTNGFLAADKSTDERALAAQDRLGATVHVFVTGGRTAANAIFVNVRLSCKRSVFVHPGYFAPATVWDISHTRYFTSSADDKSKLKSTLDALLAELQTDWKKCNP